MKGELLIIQSNILHLLFSYVSLQFYIEKEIRKIIRV